MADRADRVSPHDAGVAAWFDDTPAGSPRQCADFVKQRRIATRYDKLAANDLAFVTAPAASRHHSRSGAMEPSISARVGSAPDR
jgi:hypothetical protein